MNVSEARDEIFGLLRTAWDAAAWGGPTPLLMWQGSEGVAPPSQDSAFARATVLHQAGHQASLAGSGGARKWRRSGVVIVSCFGPNSSGNGLTIAESLAIVAMNAFEGKASPNGIWFRSCRLNEMGIADGWFQINTLANFIYDEVK